MWCIKMLLYALNVAIETKALNVWPHNPKVSFKKPQLLLSEEVKSISALIECKNINT